jgi:hypothetical protein
MDATVPQIDNNAGNDAASAEDTLMFYHCIICDYEQPADDPLRNHCHQCRFVDLTSGARRKKRTSVTPQRVTSIAAFSFPRFGRLPLEIRQYIVSWLLHYPPSSNVLFQVLFVARTNLPRVVFYPRKDPY